MNFDNWLSGSLEFSHDIYDRVESAVFEGGRFVAEIKFTYDENSNLSTIKWFFPDGNTQTYKFKYNGID